MASLAALLLSFGCARNSESQKKQNLTIANEWAIFVPPDNIDANFKVVAANQNTPSGAPALQLHSAHAARFGVTPVSGPIPVRPGERYRLSAWVKGAPDLQLDGKSSGVILRASITTAEGKKHDQGHYYVGTAGVARGAEKLTTTTFPHEWARLEGVIEIPPDATRLKFFAFCWWTKGTAYVGDAKVEKVNDTVAPTPLL